MRTTILYTVRQLILIIAFTQVIQLRAQTNILEVKTFVRIYDQFGKKIAKGQIVSLSDSTITLKRDSKIKEIQVRNIGKIKTKRSAGNNIVTGAVIGGLLGGIIGGTTYETNDLDLGFGSIEGEDIISQGDYMFSSGLTGVLAGGGLGAVSVVFKNSRTLVVNGNLEVWYAFLDLKSMK